MMIYQHTNMQTYQHTSMQTCKPITMVIYIAGSISLFRGKRSNRFRLQRQSKHGALRRLKGQAAAPFPNKSSSRFAASVFHPKTFPLSSLYLERQTGNGNERPTEKREKIKKDSIQTGPVRITRLYAVLLFSFQMDCSFFLMDMGQAANLTPSEKWRISRSPSS